MDDLSVEGELVGDLSGWARERQVDLEKRRGLGERADLSGGELENELLAGERGAQSSFRRGAEGYHVFQERSSRAISRKGS